MRILIVGAGGVGGFFGAHLLSARRDVTFLVRPGRAKQLAEGGLHLTTPTSAIALPPPETVLAPTIEHPYDLIVLSCKAYDLEAAIADLAPAIGAETAILPLLNGMAHMDLLDRRFGRRHILGGDTTVSAVKTPDGRILQLNHLDTLHFGDRDEPSGPRILKIADALTTGTYTAVLCPDITAAMWHKWLAISAAAGITCLLRGAIGDIVSAGATPLVHALLAETAAIATAAGYPPTQEHLDFTTENLTRPRSSFTASMLRDLESNAPIEAQQIIGDLLAQAQRLSVPAPLLEIANHHLRTYEARRERELMSSSDQPLS
jgi:2-dehydropantoate 2-reductase